MAAIDIGPGAIDRTSGNSFSGYTGIEKTNPANRTGRITSFEFWLNTDNGVGVKAGTFYGSGTEYTCRDFETIGAVTAGSKQTFSGLDCDVVTGDLIGYYGTTIRLEQDESGSGYFLLSGDQSETGEQTYGTGPAGYQQSIYGTGITIQTILPSAITSLEAFGNPTVLPGAVIIQPSAIASLEAFGSPTLKFTYNIFPSAIESAEAFGTPLVIPGAVIIQPSGIASLEAFGTPLVFYH